MKWIDPNTIIGPPAEGQNYFKRPNINEEFWRSISKGQHVRFTAPRRVGKSSVMKDLEANPIENMIVVYQNIESIKTSHEFYSRLWELVVEQFGVKGTTWAWTKQWAKKRGIEEVSLKGVKFKQKELDAKAELLNLIADLGEQENTIVLLLDEFPDVIVSIRKNDSDAHAIDVLHTIRAIRHDSGFKKFSLVLAGSIGLEHVVKEIDRTKIINDLNPINIPPLSHDEGLEFLTMLLDGVTIQIGADERDYLLNKLEHLMPYYIQLVVAKCNELARSKNAPQITTDDLDLAYLKVIENNENFSDWEDRLKKYLHGEDNDYCVGILTRCAHSDFTLAEAYNYSKVQKPDTGYKALIDDVLIKDGYLISDGTHIRFLSPFLKAWWQNRHPKYEIEN